jgi:hypothetical protein
MPVLGLLSSWRTRAGLPEMDEVEVRLSRNADFRRLTFETGDYTDLGQRIPNFLVPHLLACDTDPLSSLRPRLPSASQ